MTALYGGYGDSHSHLDGLKVTATAPIYLTSATFHVLFAHQGSGASRAQASSGCGMSIRVSRCHRTRRLLLASYPPRSSYRGSISDSGSGSPRVSPSCETDWLAFWIVLDGQAMGITEFGFHVNAVTRGRQFGADGLWYAGSRPRSSPVL